MMRVNADLFFALTEFSSNVMKAFRSPETLPIGKGRDKKEGHIHTHLSRSISTHTSETHNI